MSKKINSLGVMLDMSRNAVMSLPALKRYLPIIKKMGYNTVFMYTEDTYEVDGEPYFGYMRGRYSKEEMKELDAFASSIGMEVIPCIQTLAHLNGTLRWGKIPVDCADIMLTDDERTYEVIEHMFATLSECFKTRRIHVGMDEAHMLGRGKHQDIHGPESQSSIIKRHLGRVCDIAKKYGYSDIMIWSDMYYRCWVKNHDYYIYEPTEFPADVKASLVDSVVPVYWDYYHKDERVYDVMIDSHRQLSKDVWFAGGVWCWSGFTSHNKFSFRTMGPAMRSCHKNKVKNIIMTMWGDDGAECSKFSMLPALMFVAEYAKGNEDMDSIKAKFRRIVGVDFDDFIKLDLPDELMGARSDEEIANPSKYMLYSDYFNDFLDYTVLPGGSETYKKHAAELREAAKKTRKYAYLFNTAAALCEAMSVKYELGYKTRAAYEAGDKDALRALAENDYVKAEKLIRDFARTFEKQWFTDNKTCGFDVQDRRLGGIVMRTASCRRRLLDYVNGKIEKIEELEEKLLPFGKKNEPINMNQSSRYLSTNVASH